MFTLTEEELKKANEFHKDCKKKYAGAIGGARTYTFTPTSLGVIATVICGFCKQELTLTDFSDW